MPNHDQIYEHGVLNYHLMISKQPELVPFIEEIKNIRGLDIVDLGAGTGRLTVPLAPYARSIIALDASEAMLKVAAARLAEAGLSNWTTAAADHRSLPLEDRSADLAVAGWTICYLASSNTPDWRQNLRQMIVEMKRILRPNGTLVLFETLGTGVEKPKPPSFLTAYYAALTEDYGFSHRAIRTDYEFDSPRQAEELTRFFFGDELADRVAAGKASRVPECAGIWWLHV
ncbi:class I SAM-dependent methyltransferase [Paenibacillus filicis]|uniref:Class I SAM-dependent methyltransferase n=1 Tax=Paenibacillus gyeongsangnamensis TaxID=3388067 RepID=A0ABT4Q4S6_9BACL|nr:class I SAM-dependent methyltransferase [Paenibacillus filicis]MCZ8511880.1 class I SAM-dependent methyltransferase [Paenibacillus filicis]